MDKDYEYASDGGNSELSIDSLVNNAVIYIASVDESHFPIKRADITKNALPAKNGKKFLTVIEKAKELLEQIFGLILIELDGTEKVYVTVSKFTRPESVNLFQFSMEHHRKRALLLIVLSYLFMMNNSVSEEKLWKYLTQLKLVERTVNYVHPLFGNVRRLITGDFVRHMYLKLQKVVATNSQENEYAWGPRADVEFSKLEVLKFAALMQSNIHPQRFCTQWLKIFPQDGDTKSVNKEVTAKESQPVQTPAAQSQKRRQRKA